MYNEVVLDEKTRNRQKIGGFFCLRQLFLMPGVAHFLGVIHKGGDIVEDVLVAIMVMGSLGGLFIKLTWFNK